LEALRKMKRLPPPSERILRAPIRSPESVASAENEILAHSSASATTASLVVPIEEGEVPFIEVGGRGTPVDASPCVLAATPKVGFPAVRFDPVKKPPAALVEAAASVVTFRPLTVEPPTERLAGELVTFHRPDSPISKQYGALVRELDGQLLAETPAVLVFVA